MPISLCGSEHTASQPAPSGLVLRIGVCGGVRVCLCVNGWESGTPARCGETCLIKSLETMPCRHRGAHWKFSQSVDQEVGYVSFFFGFFCLSDEVLQTVHYRTVAAVLWSCFRLYLKWTKKPFVKGTVNSSTVQPGDTSPCNFCNFFHILLHCSHVL